MVIENREKGKVQAVGRKEQKRSEWMEQGFGF